jgi:hypothetical protein
MERKRGENLGEWASWRSRACRGIQYLGIALRLEGDVFERGTGRGKEGDRDLWLLSSRRLLDPGPGVWKRGIDRMPHNKLYQNSSSTRFLTLYNRGLQRSLHLAGIISMNSFCPVNLFDRNSL